MAGFTSTEELVPDQTQEMITHEVEQLELHAQHTMSHMEMVASVDFDAERRHILRHLTTSIASLLNDREGPMCPHVGAVFSQSRERCLRFLCAASHDDYSQELHYLQMMQAALEEWISSMTTDQLEDMQRAGMPLGLESIGVSVGYDAAGNPVPRPAQTRMVLRSTMQRQADRRYRDARRREMEERQARVDSEVRAPVPGSLESFSTIRLDGVDPAAEDGDSTAVIETFMGHPVDSHEAYVEGLRYLENVLTPGQLERVQGSQSAVMAMVRSSVRRRHGLPLPYTAGHPNGCSCSECERHERALRDAQLALTPQEPMSPSDVYGRPDSAYGRGPMSSAFRLLDRLQRMGERVTDAPGAGPEVQAYDREGRPAYQPEVEPLAEPPAWIGDGPAPTFASHFDLPTEHVEERPADATGAPEVPDLEGAESDPAHPYDSWTQLQMNGACLPDEDDPPRD